MSQFKIISIFILYILTYTACASTVSISCQLEKFATRDNHRGETPKTLIVRVIIFDDTRQLITDISNDEYLQFKVKTLNSLIVNAIQKKSHDKKALLEKEGQYNTTEKISELLITDDLITGEVLRESGAHAARYSYDRPNKYLRMSFGPTRGSVTGRGFYSCKEL